MIGSLNEGLELDDEVVNGVDIQQGTDETEPQPFSGSSEDLFLVLPEGPDEEVSDLESTMRSLDYVKADLVDANGISKQMALEAARYVPELVTADHPAKMYTEQITKTRFEYAMNLVDRKRSEITKQLNAKKAK